MTEPSEMLTLSSPFSAPPRLSRTRRVSHPPASHGRAGWKIMTSLILSGNDANEAQELTDAEVNHLRRLLAWLRLEYNLSEEGQRGMMIGLHKAVEAGASVERAQAVLDEEAERIRRVPAYIRQAIKMLDRAVADHDAKTRMVNSEDQS